MNLLKGIFYTSVFNDPLIRNSVRTFIGYVDTLKNLKRSLSHDLSNAYDSVKGIEDEWFHFIKNGSGKIDEYMQLMLSTGVY